MGAIDSIAAPGLSLLSIYLIPVLYLSWSVGRDWGYAATCFSAACWWMDEWRFAKTEQTFIVPVWNLVAHALLFVGMVYLADLAKRWLEAQERERNAQMERELAMALQVQRSILPELKREWPGMSMATMYTPAREVSGDFYDLIPLSGKLTGIAIGDVAGKGLPAALLMASVTGFLRSSAIRFGLDAQRVVVEVNRLLFESSSSSNYCTLFYGIYDAEQRRLYYVNAGHNPPILRRADGRVEELEKGGPVVGLLVEAGYEVGEMVLEVGDKLILYTDGVVDAMDEKGQEFGESRWLEAVCRMGRHEPSDATCRRLSLEVAQFVGGAAKHDDITLLVAAVA